MADELDIIIEEDGTIRFVYDDELAEAFDGEDARTTRASHVEPALRGGWYADMRPSGGPVLFENGAVEINEFGQLSTAERETPTGFKTREAALTAERAWLRKNRGL